MANVRIVGDACVITSSVKKDDLLKIQKYRPEALVLHGGEDGKEELFRIAATDRHAGKISTYGAEFGGETRDENQLATITMMINGFQDNLLEEISDMVGPALLKLNKLEETLPGILEEIDAEKAEILSAITVE